MANHDTYRMIYGSSTISLKSILKNEVHFRQIHRSNCYESERDSPKNDSPTCIIITPSSLQSVVTWFKSAHSVSLFEWFLCLVLGNNGKYIYFKHCKIWDPSSNIDASIVSQRLSGKLWTAHFRGQLRLNSPGWLDSFSLKSPTV